jgi:periplasmic protein TonB
MYRPPVGIPRREQKRWQGWLFSLLAHLLLLLFLLRPALDSGIDYGHRDGAGGAGPAGGGGGGLGDNAAPRLRFVQIAPHAAAPAVTQTPPTRPVPPVLPPIPTPPPPKPVPVPPVVAPPTAAAATTSPATSTPTAGAGNGIGKNGGAGAGPGSGGGVGSGEGPGKGSGVGPGTGGGAAKNYPPTLKQFVLPPLPTPASVRGFKLTAWFDVDSTGKATLLRFTPTPDRGYNDRVRETLLALRFRPAVRADGVAIRDTVDIQVLF